MARHKSHQAFTEADPALDIASLIDVCFLLLIYFIATCTIMPREQDLDVKLPVPRESDSVIDPVLIRIEASGEISAGLAASRQVLDSDTSVRELPLLRNHLEMITAAFRAAGSTPIVNIDADDQASQQRVIDVLDTLNATGIHAVTFTDLPGPAL